MIEQLLSTLAIAGIDKGAITDEFPDLNIDGDFNKMAKVGKLASLAAAIAVRRNFYNLKNMGFTSEEAIQLIVGGAMNVKAGA